MFNKNNIMLDMETLGVRPGSVILSIGATLIQPKEAYEAGITHHNFYRKIDYKNSLDCGFTTDANTIKWWEGQDRATWEEMMRDTVSVTQALNEFSDYCNSVGDSRLIWSKGADFDCVLLSEYYLRMGIERPWKYNQTRCYRTLSELQGVPAPDYINTYKHNALADAIHQADHAALIFQWLEKHHG